MSWDEGTNRYRATPVQERFWLLHELHPDLPICNEAIVLRLGGLLDHERLRVALDGIVAEHDALRTRFVQHEGVLHAVVAAVDTPCPFAIADLKGLAEPPSEARLMALVDEAARRRFDVTEGPMLRATLLCIEPERHILVLVGHHAAVDGKSMFDLLPRELGARGGQERTSRTDPSAPQTSSYADFAARERAAENSTAAPGDLEHWRTLLEGAPRTLDLPIDRHYPPRSSRLGARAERQLAPELRGRVQTLASQLGVRPFDVMCAAFVAQLMRYSNGLDLVLGTPIGKRGREPELAGLIGCCIDTLLLRARFDRMPSFEQLARELHRQRRASSKHRSLSFGTLLDALTGVREVTRNPLFQAMFNYMDFSVADLELPGLDVRAERRATMTSMLDLSLDVTEQSDGYLIALEANADVFERPHVARMLSHFATLLEHALCTPSRAIDALDMLDEDELRAVLALSRGPRLPEAAPALFHVELAHRARAFPEAVALRSTTSKLTYAALHERVAELGERLRLAGVQPGDFVLVPAQRDPIDTVVGLLAVLAAGGAFVPLDSSLPARRRDLVVRDSGARFALGDVPGVTQIAVGGPSADVQGARPRALPAIAGLTPQSPAYLLYTSGSTGRPKGVVVSHASLSHQLQARLARYDDPPARMLAPYSFAFDSALASLSWTLATGGELRLLNDAERHDVAHIHELLTRESITHFDAVPSLYQAVLARAPGNAWPRLRMVICGGETLPASLVRKHWQAQPDTRLFNEYGPTEATVFATVHELSRSTVDAITPIGAPIGDCECFVLDDAGKLAAIGHRGELHISGPGLAIGYHGLHDGSYDNSAERFVMRALGTGGEQRLYRTGDRCRYRADGVLELLGRLDDQVQIRGHRVELGEIEAVLRTCRELSDAAVVLREDERGESRLVAYIVVPTETTPLLATLPAVLRESLPSYMVPSAFVPMDELPRTANGKVDRAALPNVSSSVLAFSESIRPQTRLERDVVSIFEEVLGVSGLGSRDNFFDQGGHSLLAIKVVDLVERRLGKRLTIAAFADGPTPEAVARVLEGGTQSPKATRCIEVLHSQGDGVTFVFVGSTQQARRVAQHLAPTRRMFGINLFGLHEPGRVRDISIDWLVGEYLQELRAAQPKGPYAIGGYCDDAKIALAMTKRLREEGEQVLLVALVDAAFFVEDKLSKARVSTPQVKLEAPKKKRANLPWIRQRLERLIKYGYEDLRRLLARRELGVRKSLGLEVPVVLEHTMLFANYRAALEAYRSPSMSDGVALYVAGEWGLNDAHLVHLNDVSVHQIPGFHETLFESKPLEELAAAIQRDLAKADTVARAGKQLAALVLPLLGQVADSLADLSASWL